MSSLPPGLRHAGRTEPGSPFHIARQNQPRHLPPAGGEASRSEPATVEPIAKPTPSGAVSPPDIAAPRLLVKFPRKPWNPRQRMTRMGYRIGLDIGGTFTDFVLYDS